MKNEQIGIFINNPFIEYLVGICEVVDDNEQDKNIILAQTAEITKKKSLKDVKAQMIKKFNLKDFKSLYKEELNAVNKYNKDNKSGLTHLQILQITYSLNIVGDVNDKTIEEELRKLDLFYKN